MTGDSTGGSGGEPQVEKPAPVPGENRGEAADSKEGVEVAGAEPASAATPRSDAGTSKDAPSTAAGSPARAARAADSATSASNAATQSATAQTQAPDTATRQERGEGRIRRMLLAIPRWLSLAPEWRESRLSATLQEDDLEWTATEAEVRSLVRMLRAKHAQSRIDVHAANRLGTTAAVVGGACLCVAAYIAWKAWATLIAAIGAGRTADWHVLVATSGVILLTIAAGTLGLRVADRFYERAVRHARDADVSRQIEAAVRIALVARRSDEHTRAMLCTLAARIIAQPTRASDEKLDLSVTPEIAKEALELASKSVESASKLIKP